MCINLCLECLEAFEEVVRCRGEPLEHFGVPCYEEHTVSPCCGESYVDTFKCDYCNEYITGKYIETDDLRICENCYTEKDIVDC